MSDALEVSFVPVPAPVPVPAETSITFTSFRRVEPEGVARILRSTPCLHRLCLGLSPANYREYNGEEEEYVRTIVPALSGLKHLRELDLYQCNFGHEAILALVPALFELKHLHVLSMRGSRFGNHPLEPADAIAIAPALMGMKDLRELNLQTNLLGSEGIIALSPALMEMKNLRELRLSENEIGPEGALALAPALMGMENIHYLGLSYNNFGDEGLLAIAQTFPGMKYLHTLVLRNNEASNSAYHTALTFLASNAALTNLYTGLYADKNIEHTQNIMQACQKNKKFLKKAAFVFNELCLDPDGHMLSLELGHLIVNEIERIVYTQ